MSLSSLRIIPFSLAFFFWECVSPATFSKVTDYSRDSRYNTAKEIRMTTTRAPPRTKLAHRSLVVSEKSKMEIVNDFFLIVYLSTRTVCENNETAILFQWIREQQRLLNCQLRVIGAAFCRIVSNILLWLYRLAPGLCLFYFYRHSYFILLVYLRIHSVKRGVFLTRECLRYVRNITSYNMQKMYNNIKVTY